MKRLVALVFVVVLAGCAAPIASDTSGQIGEVDGVSHDEQLAVSTEDGLNESERALVARRAMARIEVIRGLDFDRTVDIEVINRSEYRETGPSLGGGNPDWANQRWEALFVVGETRDVTTLFGDASAAGVQGYYRPSEEQVTIVSERGADLNTETLVHELVHALQHQRFGLGGPSETMDGELGYNSVLEGEAELVTERYFDRCEAVWDCVESDGGESETPETPFGLRLYISQPYTQGQAFVAEMRDSGWDAVDALHDRPPNSSEQVIHPERYPDDRPVNVTVPDRSSAEWERLDPPTDTLGETAIYAMLLHNDIITVESSTSYDHSFSEGWAGDTLVPYQHDDDFGYVWTTEWDSQEDADQFRFAYEEVLGEHDAVERGDGRFVVPDGPFADAVRVTQEGTTVRIVNAPSVDSLSAVHSP